MMNDKEHIKSIRCAFKSEVISAKDKLEQLYKTVNSFVDRIMLDDKEDNLQEDIRTFQDMCFFLKRFCSKANLFVKILTPDKIDETKTDKTMENKTSEDVKLNKIIPYKRYSEEFTYSTIDTSKYPVGFVGKFDVIYVKDSEEHFIFVVEVPFPVINIEHFLYDDVPDAGIVFEYYLKILSHALFERTN